MFKLTVEEGPAAGVDVSLGPAPCIIGREPENTLRLNDARVSRHHAEVRQSGDGFSIKDLGSSNGTFVNGVRLSGPRHLQEGDRVIIGKNIIRFEAAPTATHTSGATLVSHHAPVVSVVAEEVQDIPVTQRPAGAASGSSIALPATVAPSPEIFEDPLTRLKTIYLFADTMRQCFSLDKLVGHILDAVFHVVRPDRGTVLMRNPATGDFEAAATRSLKSAAEGGNTEIIVSKSIITRCVDERVSVVALNAATDQRFKASESILFNRIGSAICCPLIAGDDIYGILYVDTVSRYQQFTEAELELVTGIANQAALAIGNAMHHTEEVARREMEMQLSVARRIHERLLPTKALEAAGVLAAGLNRPSSAVGGDYYGFFQMEGGPLLAIGDSTGHGVGAALLMSTARAYLVGTLASFQPSLGSLMGTLNRLLSPDMDSGLFVSFLLARIEEGGRSLRYVSAGHEPPLLYRVATHEFVELPPGGVVLGVMAEFDYPESPVIALEPGDRICFFTDGVVEQPNAHGEEFGLDQLRDAIRKHRELDPMSAVRAITDEVDSWRGAREQADDVTLVVCDVAGPG